MILILFMGAKVQKFLNIAINEYRKNELKKKASKNSQSHGRGGTESKQRRDERAGCFPKRHKGTAPSLPTGWKKVINLRMLLREEIGVDVSVFCPGIEAGAGLRCKVTMAKDGALIAVDEVV